MRATAMSMFCSFARATASSSARSTRGPGVLPAGPAAGATEVCAAAGDSAARTRAADSTAFFFTNASNTLGLKTRLLPIAPVAAWPLTAFLLRHGVKLDTLLGRQEFVDAV